MNHLSSVKSRSKFGICPVLTLIAFFLSLGEAYLQPGRLEIGANIDLELSHAGSRSHFYYNGIHRDFTDWRFDIDQMNFLAAFQFAEEWKIGTRLLLNQKLGQDIYRLQLPLLNIQWLPSESDFSFTVGRFINPFGSFNDKPLSKDRTFIGVPLAYGYYTNISDQIGFVQGMGDSARIPVEGQVQWGTTNLYYEGYATGLKLDWAVQAGKTHFELALVNGASNLESNSTDPLHFGIISHLATRFTYFWEQGFSAAYGTFLQENDISRDLGLYDYHQILLGTDFKFGFGFFEISGEGIAAFYRTPTYDVKAQDIDSEKNLLLHNFSVYLDIKYSLPFLGGSYLAYRIDNLVFGQLDSSRNTNDKWDQDVVRHGLAVGYKINPYLIIRGTASTQSVKNKPWDQHQRVFRLMLTAYY